MGRKSKIEKAIEPPTTPVIDKTKKKKKKKDKSLSPSIRSPKHNVEDSTNSPKSQKQTSDQSFSKKPKKDKEKKKKKKKNKNGYKKPSSRSLRSGSKTSLMRQSITEPSVTTEVENTSIHSEEPFSTNKEKPVSGGVLVSNFGPMDMPHLNEQDENDSLEDKSMNSADQMLLSNHHPLHDSKISLDGSNVIDERPPIGELVVGTDESDHVSAMGEPIVTTMPGTANGDDPHSPDDKDICFEDRGHPGTRAMTRVIREFLNENEGTAYSSSICKLIRKKLKGRKFLIKLRRNEETVWKEASKKEITEMMGEWFNEERRRKEEGIEDDDSDENSSLQDSCIQSNESMRFGENTDAESIPISPSAKLQNPSKTPKVSNVGPLRQNGESNGFTHSSPAPTGDETVDDLLSNIAEECRHAEEYADSFRSQGMHENGRAVEKKLKEMLFKSSQLAVDKEGGELIEEMKKITALIERVKYASIGPLLDLMERIDGNLNAYAELHDETAFGRSPTGETKSNGGFLGSNGNDLSNSSRGSRAKGMRKERTLNVGLDNEDHWKEMAEFERSMMQATCAVPLNGSDDAGYHEQKVNEAGVHGVDEPLKPGTYTETRLKGFDSDDDIGDSTTAASLTAGDLGPSQDRRAIKADYTIGLKGSSGAISYDNAEPEQSYSESVSFVTEDKTPSEVRSYTEVSIEGTDEGGEGSQSLKAEDGRGEVVEEGSTQSGHVIEISDKPDTSDEMSSVGHSQRTSLFGYDSEQEDINEKDFIETEEVEVFSDEEGSDTSESATRHPQIVEDLPNPRLEQFFDRLQHFFEVRRKVEERADIVDPSSKIRKLKVRVRAGGLRRVSGEFKSEYQQTDGENDVVRNLDDLYDAAELTREALVKLLDKLTDEVNGLYNESIELPELKPRDRAYEKAREEYRDRRPGPPESWLYDVARASVICKSYKQMSDVNKWLAKNVHIVSAKNRFYEPVFNGYRDLLFHISVPYRGKLTHICEVQVHHKDMKALDLQLGLPKHYEFFRSCFAGHRRTQEQILEDLIMMNKYGDVGSMMVKLLKSKDADQIQLFADLCYEKLEEFDKALELYRRILILQEDEHGDHHERIAETHLKMGRVQGAKGLISESLKHLQKALKIQESVLGRDNIGVAELLTEIGRMLSKKGDYEGALIKFEKALEIRESTFGNEHFLVIASLQDIGKAFGDMGDFTAAEVTYRKALAIQEQVLGGVHPDVAATYHMIGTCLCQYGDFGKAMEEHRLALSIRETTLGKNHPTAAESQTDIGIVLCQKGEYDVAEWRHRKALRIRELKGKDDEDCAISLSYLGDVLSRKGQHDEAEAAVKRALMIREKNLGMDHPITADSYIDLGNVYYKKGDSHLALKEFRRARVAREVILGPRHPDTAVAFSCMGNALNLQRDYEGAFKMHSKAVDIFEDILGEDHPLTASGYQNIADTLLLMGNKDEALTQHRKALAVRANILSKDHPDTALSCSRIGDLLAEKDDLENALLAYRQALAITVDSCGEDNVDSAKAHTHVGLVLAAQGEFDEALDELEQATRVLEGLLGKSHEETARAYGLIGSIYSATGQFDEALGMHTQAYEIYESIYGEDHPKTEAVSEKCRMAEDGEAETEF
eukprot:scaffold8535_cov132-Cylindrotheca_fusiformis.AAC.13